MTICLPCQLTIGREEKTMIAISRRVSSVADSIGSLNKLRRTTSAKVIAIKKNRAKEARMEGPWASRDLTHEIFRSSADDDIDN